MMREKPGLTCLETLPRRGAVSPCAGQGCAIIGTFLYADREALLL
jgi:hypothetical protein